MNPFGDVEAAVVAIVGADEDVGDVTVSTDMRGYEHPARWVHIVRTGGVPTLWMTLDNANVSVAVYAEDKGAALDLAGAVRRAVFAARGVYEGNGLTLYDVMDGDGLAWSPDEKNDTTARYVFGLVLVTRPA